MNRTLIVLGSIAIFILIVIFFYVLFRGQGENISLTITPSQNVANVLTAVQNSGNTSPSTYTGESNTQTQAMPQDAVSLIRTIPEASAFVSLLENSGVAAEISPAGSYTFFVPTNAAFRGSVEWPLSSLSFAEQKRLAEYHIVSGAMMSIDAVKFGHITMLSRDLLNASVFDTPSVGGNSHVVATYRVPGSIIYLVDIVLLPPAKPPFPFF